MNDTLIAENFNKGFREAVKKTDEHSEAKNIWHKSPFAAKISMDTMVNAVAEDLSKNLTNGLVKLTLEEISENKYKMEIPLLEPKLSCIKVYAEFIIKSGPFDLKTFRFEFYVKPSVKVEDIEINTKENSISFGSFNVAGDIFILKEEEYIKLISIGPKPLDLSKIESKIKLKYKKTFKK